MSAYLLRSLALALAGLPALASCAALEGTFGRPTVSVTGVALRDIGIEASTLVFDLSVHNPYDVPLPLVDLGYDLSSDGMHVLGGQADVAGNLPAGQSKVIQVPVQVSYLGVLAALKGVRPGAVIPYDAHFDLAVDAPVVGRLALPIDKAGTFPIPTLPRIRLAAVDWKELGLQGASGSLDVEIENANAFPVELGAFSYAISLGGHDVVASRLQDRVQLKEGGVHHLQIPVSLSMLELGGGLLSILRGGDADYRVAGDLQLDTPWGPIPSPFEALGQAASKL